MWLVMSKSQKQQIRVKLNNNIRGLKLKYHWKYKTTYYVLFKIY